MAERAANPKRAAPATAANSIEHERRSTTKVAPMKAIAMAEMIGRKNDSTPRARLAIALGLVCIGLDGSAFPEFIASCFLVLGQYLCEHRWACSPRQAERRRVLPVGHHSQRLGARVLRDDLDVAIHEQAVEVQPLGSAEGR